MSKQSHKVTAQPRAHSADCECIVCRRKQNAAPGGARKTTVDNVHVCLPLLSADDRSRWSRLVDTTLEHDGKRGWVTERDDLLRWAGREREAAWQVWSTSLTEEERTCFALHIAQGLSQRETARRLGTSQATVHRRVRAATVALAAACG